MGGPVYGFLKQAETLTNVGEKPKRGSKAEHI